MLGRFTLMSKSDAEAVLSALLREINGLECPVYQAGLHVRAVHKRRVSPLLPSQLEGIDCRHIGADRQVASRAGIRKGSSFCDSARGVAGFSGPKGARSFGERRVSPAVVSERDFQARSFGWAGIQQSGGGVEDSEKCQRTGDASTDGKGGSCIPGGLRSPGKLIARLAIFEGLRPGGDFGSSLEGAPRHHSGGGTHLQASSTRRKTARSAKEESRMGR